MLPGGHEEGMSPQPRIMIIGMAEAGIFLGLAGRYSNAVNEMFSIWKQLLRNWRIASNLT